MEDYDYPVNIVIDNGSALCKGSLSLSFFCSFFSSLSLFSSIVGGVAGDDEPKTVFSTYGFCNDANMTPQM